MFYLPTHTYKKKKKKKNLALTLTFGITTPHPAIIDKTTTETMEHFKYLGLTLDNNFSFDTTKTATKDSALSVNLKDFMFHHIC